MLNQSQKFESYNINNLDQINLLNTLISTKYFNGRITGLL